MRRNRHELRLSRSSKSITTNPKWSKKKAEKNNDTSRILCCYSVIPNFQQIDVASARGLTDSVEAVAGLGHFRRFRRNSGQRGLRRTGSHGRDASWRHFRVEQREPKMLELRDLDSFGIGFQTWLDVLESIGVYRFWIICQVSEPLWTCLNHESRLCNLVFTAHATHAVSWLPLSRTAVRRTPMIKFLVWL